MTFMIEFRYDTANRDKVLHQLHEGRLSYDGLTIKGAWIAAQTGLAYALLETDDAAKLYEACSLWSDYGELRLSPVIPAKSV